MNNFSLRDLPTFYLPPYVSIMDSKFIGHNVYKHKNHYHSLLIPLLKVSNLLIKYFSLSFLYSSSFVFVCSNIVTLSIMFRNSVPSNLMRSFISLNIHEYFEHFLTLECNLDHIAEDLCDTIKG